MENYGDPKILDITMGSYGRDQIKLKADIFSPRQIGLNGIHYSIP